MTMNRRTFLGSTAAAAVTGSLATTLVGCDSNQSKTAGTAGKGAITLWNGWTGGNNSEMLNKILTNFAQSPQGFKVANTTLPWGDLFVKWLLAAKSGNPPDVVIYHQTEVAQFASTGVTRPITDLVQKSDIDLTLIPESSRNLAHYNGQLYSIPVDYYSIGLYYNTDLVSKAGLDPARPPATLDDLLNWAEKMTVRKANKIVQEGCTFYGAPLLWSWQSLRNQFGGGSLLEGGKWQFDDQPAHQALQLMVDLIQKYNVANPPPTSTQVDPFGSQNAGMQMNGPWNVNLRMSQKLKFKTAPLHLGMGSKKFWANGHALSISKASSDALTDEDVKFMSWFSKNYAQAASTVGTIPLNKDVLASKVWTGAKQNQYYGAFQQDLSNAVFDPSIRNYSQVFEASATSAALNFYIPQALRNQISVNDALGKIQSQISAQAQVS